MQVATICYCLDEEKILLGMKKIRFGAGKWNGFGGKVGTGEGIAEAARREVVEECGLTIAPEHIQQVALISFYFGETPMFECHIFFANQWEGETHESDEMVPKWFPRNMLPYKDMWVSDLFWFPAVLSGVTLEAVCHFDAEGKAVEDFVIKRRDF
ncbi:MAG TPA: 8-oxo-dGTP diphosphatase [Candidatus Paceibacterota bacterium]|nr:8-oxo-dGTP diphosphatase [Candidatus Paceibacterota bacterium]